MAKEKKCEDCPALPGWITTFSDLMSLLLTFFVLLLSFSTTKQADFEKAVGSLHGALGVLAGEPILTSPVKLNIPIIRGDITEARPTLKDAKAEIEKEVEAEGQQENVEIIQSEEGITIRIKDNAVYASGAADIKQEFLPLLNKIGGVLARLPNPVEIEGHTDNMPIENDEFPNNHWLSSSRALGVLDVFRNEVGIAPERLAAIGFGEFKPLVPNDSDEGRAANRRVEIKIRHLQDSEGSSEEMIKQLIEEAELGVAEKAAPAE
ncbi:MAG: flagellar motor protein MotB [Candidatus Latescibacterota bacterium]|nr:flagellar motor protein MotB [Candidatus Latescibacterota bacterium]